MKRHLALASVLLIGWSSAIALAAGAAGKKAPPKKDDDKAPPVDTVDVPDKDADAVDISAAKKRMITLTDGKKHFVVVVPFAQDDDERMTFWSVDGKTFFRLRVRSTFKSGNEQWEQGFIDQRFTSGYQSTLMFKDNAYTVECEERISKLTPLSASDSAKMIDGGKFYKARFKRDPYALARDDKGNYFYVDRALEPENNKNFRLFVGPKGNLALTKLVNVVSDSEGDIFSTKTGELRLVLNKNDAKWIANKDKTELTNVPVEDNIPMIFTELGVYTGVPLGTPCDEL
jgi:hypothetical protein